MPKKSCFRGPFEEQHGKRAQALLKSASHQKLLVNKLAANQKYPVLNRDNLTIPIQMQFSQKKKTFSELFAAFLESI